MSDLENLSLQQCQNPLPCGFVFCWDTRSHHMFKEVNQKANFPNMEKKILAFWDQAKIFEKSLEQRANIALDNNEEPILN